MQNDCTWNIQRKYRSKKRVVKKLQTVSPNHGDHQNDWSFNGILTAESAFEELKDTFSFCLVFSSIKAKLWTNSHVWWEMYNLQQTCWVHQLFACWGYRDVAPIMQQAAASFLRVGGGYTLAFHPCFQIQQSRSSIPQVRSPVTFISCVPTI